MKNLAAWSHFLAQRAKSPPLAFLSGVRLPVKTGVCCRMHSHDAFEIVYHPRGRGVTRLGRDRSVAFDVGDAVVYAPREMHDQVMDSEGEDLCVRIGLPPGRRVLPQTCFSVRGVKDAAIIEDIRLLTKNRAPLDSAEQAIFDLRATSTLYALIHLASARSEDDREAPVQNYVAKAERYIRENFAGIKNLAEVARVVGISYDHLRHLFRRQRRKSLVAFLNEVRMERAKTLLIHSQMPLKQVATMCGFRDEYYFSAVFRRFAQMPPGRYRATLS